MAAASIIHILAVMNYTFRQRLLCISAAICPIFLTTPAALAASTALWVGNPGVTATTNWSDIANWSVAPLQNDAKFGGTGSAGDINTITSVVDANQGPLSLQYTNNSQTGTSFHNTFIPAGVTLSVGNGALTIGGLVADNYRTQVKITGGGTLLVTNALTIGNNTAGTTGNDQQTLLDLSGLTNFVYNAPTSTITMGTGNRSAGDFTLAANSNSITAATWNANIASSSSSVSGVLNLGAGTNIINVNTFAISASRGSCTVNLPSAAGLRLRGTGGTDSDRANVTVGNHNVGGSGSQAVGSLNFNGATVDLKIGTLNLGQASGSPTGNNPGNGTLNFDAGVVDANAINMATASGVAFSSANGTINVGANGTLIVGAGGISMVNLTGAVTNGSGTLNINGGTNLVSGNIRKTSVLGAATLSVNGTLKLIGSTNVIGVAGNPIDTVNLTDSKLTLPVNNGGATIVANTFNANGSTDTINVSSLPGIGAFPTQLPVISYTAFNGNYDFVLGSLPGTYQGYLSNNTAGFSIDLVITNSQVKTDTWRGNVSGNWDTSTLNWFSGGAVNYQQGDLVVFDDTLTGTANVNLTTTLLPQAISVNNSVFNYTFSGAGKLSGTSSISKSGTGTLTLSETGGDDFTGGIIVNGGTVILDNTNATIAGGLNIISGTAQIGNNDGKGTVPSGGITDDGLLVFNATNNFTVGTAITGGGALVQKGSGRLTLSGANLYSGSTVVSNGTLALSGAGDLSSSLQLIVNNAGLDLSALSQQRTLNGFNVTNATMTLAVIGGVTNISASSITSGGAGNVINVSAIPPIASYPVSFGVIQSAGPIGGNFNFSIGTLPPATPAYVANVTQSPDQTTVLVTITAGPVGTRPSVVWSGADVPNLNTNWSDRLNWQLPGAPTASDNVIFNNTASVFASALSSPGGGSSALIFDNVNNIVDNNFTISSLTYTNSADSYHNTFIKTGNSLNTTNLTVGAFDSGSGAQHEFVTVSGGANASLNVSNTAANLQVWVGSGSVGGSQATLDLSALDTFNATLSRLTVGASAINNAVNRPSGILYLAKTNSIKTGFQTTTSEAGTTTGNSGIVVGDCNGNAGSASFIYLGQVNTISADTIGIGRQKVTSTILFNPLYANVAPYPTVTFQGFSSNQVSIFDVGDGIGNTGTTSCRGNLNLNGGIVNATVDTMNIGRASSGVSGTSSGTSSGQMFFDAGTITVNTMNIGLQPAPITKYGAGTNNVGSNSVIGASATLVVRGSLNLAFADLTFAATNSTGLTSIKGLLNITNGTVRANRLVPGTNSTSMIGIYGGTLVATNPIGNASGPLGTLELAPLGTPDNSRNTLNLPVGYDSLAGLTVASLNIDGLDTTTNVINIESVGPVGATPVELPIIQYQTMTLLSGATFNIGLGTLPAGYSGYLTNDTASSMIGLVLTSAIHPQPRMTSIVQSGSNLVVSGINGFANGPFHVLASTDVTAPLSTWTSVASGVFGPTGNFTFSTPIDPAKPQQFFIVQVP
jgi:autotransporter-associated beta strand protein